MVNLESCATISYYDYVNIFCAESNNVPRLHFFLHESYQTNKSCQKLDWIFFFLSFKKKRHQLSYIIKLFQAFNHTIIQKFPTTFWFFIKASFHGYDWLHHWPLQLVQLPSSSFLPRFWRWRWDWNDGGGDGTFSCVWLFTTPWTAACQASLSFTISPSLLKLKVPALYKVSFPGHQPPS